MAVLSKEDLLKAVRDMIGENSDDASLALLEDITDTFGDYETRISDSGDWKARYEENDQMWRTRYRDRFFGGGEEPETPEVEEVTEKKTYEDLFKEGD